MAYEQEYKLTKDGIIVSKTDLKGRITYANRYFMQVVGRSEPELLGKPHNVIRHSDMPRGVFYFLWHTLQRQEEFFGYVKNVSANGGYYWVLANITPDFANNSNVVGYFSVRRRPNYAAVKLISTWYQQMLAIEAKTSSSQAPKASFAWLQEQIDKQGVSYNDLIWQLEGLGEK